MDRIAKYLTASAMILAIITATLSAYTGDFNNSMAWVVIILLLGRFYVQSNTIEELRSKIEEGDKSGVES